MIRILALFLATMPTLSRAADPAPADAPKPPRAARSVHLAYPLPANTDADAFYNELTVEQSVPGSYFMAAGFRHGYFGIQEQSRGQKVVIFSVWDPTKGNDAKNVPLEQRVEVLHQDKDVDVKRFGGEGTGGQSFLKFDWQPHTTYRFCVRAKTDGEKTAYSAYFYLPEAKTWKHLVTFRTKAGGDKLKGLYSFVEDFKRDTTSATQTRRALFTNAWIQVGPDLKPLLTARFTASGATWEAQETIDAGVVDAPTQPPALSRERSERDPALNSTKLFYLQTGGPTKTTTPLNSTLTRPQPANTKPPELPVE